MPVSGLVVSFTDQHAMRQQARNFIAAVKGEMQPLTTAAEGLEDLKLAREYIRLRCGK